MGNSSWRSRRQSCPSNAGSRKMSLDVTSNKSKSLLKRQQTLDSGSLVVPNSKPDHRKRTASFVFPIEKLIKVLCSQTNDAYKDITSINLIAKDVFKNILFKNYDEFAERIFDYCSHKHKIKDQNGFLSSALLQKEFETLLEITDDDKVIQAYIDIYSDVADNTVTVDSFEKLLCANFQVVRDFGTGCDSELKSAITPEELKPVIQSCFHSKDRLSCQFVCNWLLRNCTRLLRPLHQYAIFVLSVAYRYYDESSKTLNASACFSNFVITVPILKSALLDELQSAVLKLPLTWILSSSLDSNMYLCQNLSEQCAKAAHATSFVQNIVANAPTGASPAAEKPTIIWTLLYNSSEHGLGSNRFLHHVLSYNGPTVTLLKTDTKHVYAIASSSEWKESHLYYGNDSDALYQLLPEFMLLESGPKLMYLNTSIRGYPFGLRVASNPRKPTLVIDGDFNKISYSDIPYQLISIESWGCGAKSIRDKQLDLHNWQSRQIEKQRIVKLSPADWNEHPDRYLLGMAGRPQYSDK